MQNALNKGFIRGSGGIFALFINLVIGFALTFGFANTALAAIPTLNVSSAGNNIVQLNVTNADPNSSIILYYNQPSSASMYVATIGTTNSSGYFSTTLNQNSYSIPQSSYVYVVINNQTSPAVLWPNNNNTNYGNVTLSQTSLTMAYNQSTNVSVYGGNGTYYISSNSNSSIASASLSGTILSVMSNNTAGNSTITVCSYNNSGCATLYVYTQTSYNQPTYLSQTSINLSTHQGQAVTIYGSGSYSISSNTNPTAISALVSGTVLNVYGSNPGSGTLNVCSGSGGGGCATLYVTVTGGYYDYNNYNNNYTSYNNGYNYNGYNNYNSNYNNGYSNGYNTYYNSYRSGSVLGASTDVPYNSSASQVYLSQVPATGVSFASLKVILFTSGLLIWSLFAAYIYSAKQKRRIARQ